MPSLLWISGRSSRCYRAKLPELARFYSRSLKIEREANGEVAFKLTVRMGAGNVNELENLITVETLSVFSGVVKGTASSSRIAQHTSASGSRENGTLAKKIKRGARHEQRKRSSFE